MAKQTTQPSSPRPRPAGRLPRLVGWVAWATFAWSLAWWATLGLGADRWWLATALSFGPRWIALVPVLVVLPLVLWLRRRLYMGMVAVAAAVVFVPVLGLELSAAGLMAAWADGDEPRERRIRVATVNGAGRRLQPELLTRFVESHQVDVVAVQECQRREDFPQLWPPSWAVHTSRGLCLASRFAIEQAGELSAAELGGDGAAARYELRTPWGPVAVFNVHLETPRRGLEALLRSPRQGPTVLRDIIQVRDRESAAAVRWAGEATAPTVVLGDFNLPVDSTIYRRHWSRWRNAFSVAGLGFGDTKRTRWYGLRIDHILVGEAWEVPACRVGVAVGSDHLPVVADLIVPQR